MIRPSSILTVFHDLRVEHLYKDVGAIPYHLSSECGWHSAVAFFGAEEPFNAQHCANWREKVTLLSLGARQGLIGNAWRIFCLLASRGREFDLLNFYHDSSLMMVYALVFKLFNPSGKVYFKLDYGPAALDAIRHEERSVFLRLRRRLKMALSRKAVDLYSVETQAAFATLEADPYFSGRIVRIPNGFACPPLCINEILALKEKLILTVGNLGSFAKNTELLVRAIASLDPAVVQGWQVVLCGSVVNNRYYEEGYAPQDQFTPFLERVIQEHPHLKEIFVLTGPVCDREALFALYSRAKIFCLTSRYEGFPHVIAEAMWFGNLLVATDLPACRDITAGGYAGELFPSEDRERLSAILSRALVGEIDLNEKGQLSHQLVGTRFSWNIIVKDLERALGLCYEKNTPASCGRRSE